MRHVGSVLYEIYKIYFEHEYRGNEQLEKLDKINEKKIFEFLRDFDIFPTLISKSVSYKIYLSC